MAVRFYSEDCSFIPCGKMKTAAWVRESIINEGFRVGDISFVFCSRRYHLNMNRQYLGHDYPTDVITFDYGEGEPDNRRLVSGDIFIDWQQAEKQAADWNSYPEEELMRVMIHGVMHLCGYNDAGEADRTLMRGRENFYLARYLDINGKFPGFKVKR